MSDNLILKTHTMLKVSTTVVINTMRNYKCSILRITVLIIIFGVSLLIEWINFAYRNILMYCCSTFHYDSNGRILFYRSLINFIIRLKC